MTPPISPRPFVLTYVRPCEVVLGSVVTVLFLVLALGFTAGVAASAFWRARDVTSCVCMDPVAVEVGK